MRYRVMSVPGRREDGTDTAWFVLDFHTRHSTLVGTGDAARPVAIRRATERNNAARQARRERSAAARRARGSR